MDDLEMTKACAHEMGIEFHAVPADGSSGIACYVEPSMASKNFRIYIYDPLHDDAQAMALVRKFHLGLYPYQTVRERWWWKVGISDGQQAMGEDVNRAIVECVAKMQSTKSAQSTDKAKASA